MPGPNASHPERLPQFDPTVIAEIVARTRAEQGLPPTISDPAVLARLAVMVQGGNRRGTR